MGGYDESNIEMNVMQLLHGVYNLQNYHEQEELIELSSFFDDSGIKKTK